MARLNQKMWDSTKQFCFWKKWCLADSYSKTTISSQVDFQFLTFYFGIITDPEEAAMVVQSHSVYSSLSFPQKATCYTTTKTQSLPLVQLVCSQFYAVLHVWTRAATTTVGVQNRSATTKIPLAPPRGDSQVPKFVRHKNILDNTNRESQSLPFPTSVKHELRSLISSLQKLDTRKSAPCSGPQLDVPLIIHAGSLSLGGEGTVMPEFLKLSKLGLNQVGKGISNAVRSAEHGSLQRFGDPLSSHLSDMDSPPIPALSDWID